MSCLTSTVRNLTLNKKNKKPKSVVKKYVWILLLNNGLYNNCILTLLKNLQLCFNEMLMFI